MQKFHLQVACAILPILVTLGSGLPVAAQSAGKPASPIHSSLRLEEIVSNMVRKNLERAQRLGAYQGTRTYRLQYQGFPGNRSAEMVVDVKYQSPETKEFTIRSSSGSQLLIDRVFKKLLQSEQEALTAENQAHVALNNENYSFSLAGQETTPSGPSYVLSVEPKTKNKLLYRGRIWVDATDFAVVRIEASPAKSPSFWTKETKIEHVYGKVGDFWLPISNHSTSATRLGGHAYLTIDYKDYKVTAASAWSAPGGNVAGRQ